MNSPEDTGSTAAFPFGFVGNNQPLFDDLLSVSSIKKELNPILGTSAQWRKAGRVPHPINYEAAIRLMLSVDIQQTCIQTKRDATVGLGFETEEDQQARKQKQELSQHSHDVAMGRVQTPSSPVSKIVQDSKSQQLSKSKVEEVLDPLCEVGFQALMSQLGEDFENTSMCYIEVVRESESDSGKVTALWHMPASCVYVVNEKKPNYHYEMDDGGGTIRYARFGDLERFKKDNPNIKQEQTTELIRIRMPTSLDPHYSYPSWLSVTPWLELAQKMLQFHFDFFDNRAIPSLLVLLTGGQVLESEMKVISDQLKETIGPGKRFRSLLAAIKNPNIQAHIERLESEKTDAFADLWSAVQLKIVSSHRIPPLLAGVTLPGKMAAANELPNALIAFQTLYIDPNQRLFEQVLGSTLGNPQLSGGLGLSPSDFKLKKITDAYDMGQVDTMSRMRETATEAQMSGRKLQDGLKN